MGQMELQARWMNSGHKGKIMGTCTLVSKQIWPELNLLISLSILLLSTHLCCQLQATHCKALCLTGASYWLCKLHLRVHLDLEEIKVNSQ